jgi:hypothetical protein
VSSKSGKFNAPGDRTSPRISRAGRQLLPWPGCGRRFHHAVEAEAAGLRAWIVYPTLSKVRLKTWSVDKMVDKDSSCMKHLH